MSAELVDSVQEALTVSEDDFAATVEREAERLKEELRDGTFDNPQAIVGLEYELYGVAENDATLERMPRPLLELVNFEGELGLHNAEFHTNPQPFNAFGLRAQQTEAQSRLEAAQTRARTEEIRLVSDGLWTVPPAGESAETYLTDSVVRDGTRITTNMADDTRYQAMANADTYSPKRRIETPHVELSADVVMPESLTTSIQPHYQVPHAPDLPERFRYALRVAGPLLVLGVNSPFFPPELYDTDDAYAVLDDQWMENRIPVFEGVFNPEERRDKVRFPADVTTVEQAIDRIATDPTLVPMRVESEGRFDDTFRHFEHKHGSFWRWVRPVFDGATRSAANARIEFRALPAQPTIRDSLAFVAAFAGLMESLPRREHPVLALDWEVARENFDAAMRDGLDADLRWITSNGEDVTDTETILAELLECARDGLSLRGLSASEADEYLDLLRVRLTEGVTPAEWKRREVRRRVEDGESLVSAVRGMQAAYVERQSETLVDGTFHEWLND
ncbi:hypothetical protein [Halorussus sp. MSC15.2]|uniref:hypothetical protein n=1 Tax=Halorussus sp. MSC15.2 TaxID=2283638 RepID=UPI0013D03107|nr:hypothetical protein [Halorussus sp. MSC15.2]NEU56128.1 hypothetical protein [Halorussus sp. MSC15.2]